MAGVSPEGDNELTSVTPSLTIYSTDENEVATPRNEKTAPAGANATEGMAAAASCPEYAELTESSTIIGIADNITLTIPTRPRCERRYPQRYPASKEWRKCYVYVCL